MKVAEAVCNRCESPVERDELRCPICNAAAPHTAAEDLETTAVEILRCDGCGAAVAYDIRVRAPACAFCGSVMRVETPDDPLEQTQERLPFTVDRTTADYVLRRWLQGLGWFRPSDLQTASTIESMTALWWVGWVFDALVTVTWTADSDAGARRADWAPHAGQTDLEFDDMVVSASRGLSAAEADRLIPSYDLGSARPAAASGNGETVRERFDVHRSVARGRVASHIRQTVTDRLKDGVIPGTRHRNIHAALVPRRLVTRRVAFPAYVIAYRYRKALYRLVLSGQDADCLIGSAPYSTVKIVAVVIGGLAAAGILLTLLATM
jgi:hypothetical protein